ncbi:MAG: hypothetical protein IPN99_09810 [Bacteroidetes bacterium]|nr:hypothetical protein [Bacteroidota bacterium]
MDNNKILLDGILALTKAIENLSVNIQNLDNNVIDGLMKDIAEVKPLLQKVIEDHEE